jgi:6-phosphofructokinase 1
LVILVIIEKDRGSFPNVTWKRLILTDIIFTRAAILVALTGRGRQEMETVKRIGILTGGGDCPGLNAAIRASVKTAIQEGYQVTGIRNGWSGFFDNDYEELDNIRTSGIIDRGGTILGTSRFSPLTVEGGPQLVLEEVKKLALDGLIVIGGEGTLTVAYLMFQLGLPVVGIPKTIDNDVRGTDYTIGFQTAVEIATEALDRLRSTAESHHRVMLLEVMGRHAGWIATYAGMANGADAILIPEIPLNKARRNWLFRMLNNRSKKGISFSVIVVAEGTILEGKTIGNEASGKFDTGDRQLLGGVGRVLGDIIQQGTGLETKVSSLGYIQRGGTPAAYDRSLATCYGVKAVYLVEQKKYGEMTAIVGNRITASPLSQVAEGIKPVPMEVYRFAQRFFG